MARKYGSGHGISSDDAHARNRSMVIGESHFDDHHVGGHDGRYDAAQCDPDDFDLCAGSTAKK